MNSITKSKLSAVIVGIGWTAWLLRWDFRWNGSFDPASAIMVVICGILTGYLCYLVSRRDFRRRERYWLNREPATNMKTRWIAWIALMMLAGLITAYSRPYVIPLIPPGRWRELFSVLFSGVFPLLMGTCTDVHQITIVTKLSTTETFL